MYRCYDNNSAVVDVGGGAHRKSKGVCNKTRSRSVIHAHRMEDLVFVVPLLTKHDTFPPVVGIATAVAVAVENVDGFV